MNTTAIQTSNSFDLGAAPTAFECAFGELPMVALDDPFAGARAQASSIDMIDIDAIGRPAIRTDLAVHAGVLRLARSIERNGVLIITRVR
jgi:hypothetical protein